MASGGLGALGHVSGELFKAMTGVNMVHVPYRGDAAALTDLLGGQVQVHFAGLASSIDHIKAGTLHALAVTTDDARRRCRMSRPSATSCRATSSSAWFGIGAPKNTPHEIVDKLNNEINAALADPKIKERLADVGGTVLPGSPAHFGDLIADDTAKWAKVVKLAGIKPE